MSERDADFSSPVKRIIAARAGYRCSLPGCDESTIGPGSGPNDIESKGIAAHIFSASGGEKGPRGTGGLSAEERSRPENGLWLCADHADLVDTDNGRNYPANILQAWKAIQEYRIGRELQKLSPGQSSWLDRITIEDNMLFRRGTTIVLGKVTLLVGANSTGKSALCEWISACAGGEQSLLRWSGFGEAYMLVLRLRMLMPDQVEFTTRFHNYKLHAECVGKRVFDLSHALRVIHIVAPLRRTPFEDDLEYLARMWRVHLYHVCWVVEQLASSKYGKVEKVEFRPAESDEDEESEDIPEDIVRMRNGRPPQVLWVKFAHHKKPISFQGLSGSEQDALLISGAIVLAESSSQHQATLLLLDLGLNFDDARLSEYAERLQGSQFKFQTILVSPSERPKVCWTGWSIARLIGKRPNVSFDQIILSPE